MSPRTQKFGGSQYPSAYHSIIDRPSVGYNDIAGVPISSHHTKNSALYRDRGIRGVPNHTWIVANIASQTPTERIRQEVFSESTAARKVQLVHCTTNKFPHV
jgi:hypothetical protein